MSINTIIEWIKKRPEMYLGSKSITALLHFLNGYHMAMTEFERDETGKTRKLSLLPLDFYYMHEYVAFRLGVRNNRGWCQNLLAVCGGNEEEGLEKFFELYSEFSEIEIRRCKKAVLNEENIEYNNSMFHGYAERYGVKKPIYPDPKAIYAVELSIGAFMLAVEDANGIDAGRYFFHSNDNWIDVIAVEAERYFGKISDWEEITEKNICLEK